MRVRFFQSLPVRLAGLILLLSGAALLVLTELNRRAVERILQDQAEVQAVLATSAVTHGLDAVLGATEQIARLTARELQGPAPAPADLARDARNAVLASPDVFGVSIALEPAAGAPHAGVYVHRSAAPGGLVTRDLTTAADAYWQRDWYRAAVAQARLVWGEPYYDPRDAEGNVVRVSVPFYHATGDEHPAGVVSAVVALDWLRRLANTNEFSDRSHVIVFSRSGRIVLHPNPRYAIAETMATLAAKTGSPELAEIRQRVLARRQGALTYRDGVTGRRIHANYQPARLAGWGVVVSYDEAEFAQNQRRFRGLAAGYLGATLLVLGGIVIGVTRAALRPVGALAAATGEIARGNLDCALPAPRRADEVGRLAAAFRGMRDALKAQSLERRWAALALEQQLKHNELIIDSIGELVFVLTRAMSISRLNPAVTRTTGYAAEELVQLPLGRVVQLDPPAGSGLEALEAAMREGRLLHDLPVRVVAKDQAAHPARLALAPLLDHQRIVGAVVTLRMQTPVPAPARA